MVSFILAASIVFLFFAIIWRPTTMLNVGLKMMMTLFTVWGWWLLLGPRNLILQLVG